MNLNDLFTEEKVRLDPKCWTGKKIGNPKTKMKGGTRVNNCVPAESVNEMDKSQTPPGRDGSNDSGAGKKEYTAKATTAKKVAKDGEKILNKELNKKQGVAEGLDEAVGGNYLYHATSPAGLKGILQSGYIGAQQTAQPATDAQTKLPSVAVTRDWNYASGSARSSEGVGQGAVIVLDRNSIESKYKTFGTSQSSMIKGLPNTTTDSPQMKKLAQQIKFKDANKNGKLDYNELPAGAVAGSLKHSYFRPKAGGEAEEAVVVPKGNLPLQGSMIGFWVDPNGELGKDPTIMNDPRRLDMPRPNQFVKANQAQGVAEEYELAGVGVAYELGRRAYKQGMTIRDNPYSATKEARKNDEWAKGLERGKHDANDARHFRSSVREQAVAEDQLDEKSVSQAQFRTMAAAAHNPEFAKKVGISQDVAQEFHGADRKQEYKKLPDRTTEGWKDVVAGGALALGALGAGAQTMPNMNVQQVELANKYYNALVQRATEDGRELDTRTLNFLKAKAQDAAALKLQQASPQKQQGFPTQGSERRVAKDAGQFESQGMAEGKPKEKEADYGDNYQDMVARVKKLAGLGPLKTVYDPTKRVYRNVPTAVQPKK